MFLVCGLLSSGARVGAHKHGVSFFIRGRGFIEDEILLLLMLEQLVLHYDLGHHPINLGLLLYNGDLESKFHIRNAGTSHARAAAGCFGLQKIQLVNDVFFAHKATDIKDTLREDPIFDPFAHLLLKLDAYLLGLVKLVMLVISEELRMHLEYFIYVCRALLRRVDSIAVLPIHPVVAPLDLKVDTHEAALALSPSEETRRGWHVQGDDPESDHEVLLINVFSKPLYVFRHPSFSSYFYN